MNKHVDFAIQYLLLGRSRCVQDKLFIDAKIVMLAKGFVSSTINFMP